MTAIIFDDEHVDISLRLRGLSLSIGLMAPIDGAARTAMPAVTQAPSRSGVATTVSALGYTGEWAHGESQ